EPAGRGRDHAAGEDERDVVGTAERELVADHALKPGPACLRAVENARVGELDLTERELVAVAGLAVCVRERARQQPLVAPEERPHLALRKARADRGQRVTVGAGAETVVERLERQARLLGLPLCPLVPVEAQPEREGSVGAGLDERRPPLAVADVEVVVVDEHALAAEAEVRMAVAAALPPAAPGRRLLLRDPDQDDAEAALADGRRQIRTHALLLRLAPIETDDWNRVLGRETL